MNSPNPSTHSQDRRFQALLNDGRDMVLVFLSAQLNDMFGNTDEALLDFAEHAQNNALQSRFFEAMGAVRRYRSEIEHIFREEIHSGFDHFFHPPEQTADVQKISASEMTLVKQEDMDESVAMENLITQCRNNYFMQLSALAQRLAILNQGSKIREEDIPGGPTHLVKSFRVSIRSLTIDAKAKIVLYALFNKFVLGQLKGLYDEFNGNLINAGILPNLKPTFIRSESRAAAPQHQAADTQQQEESQQEAAQETANAAAGDGAGSSDTAAAPLGEELFSSVLDLLAARHRRAKTQSADSQTPPGEGAAAPAEPPAAVAAAAHTELLSTLDNIRPQGVGQGRGVLSDLDALPKVAADPKFLDSLKDIIASEREDIYSQIPSEQMHGIDADTIDLIGMLFEYMLNDPLLPNLAKALLSHLHTPYLKLSLNDSTLLVDSEHPARLLLDLLVEAGGQWVYENDMDRGIYPQMQGVVDRVLKEIDDSDEMLPELLELFEASVNEYRRRSEAVEQRAQESVKGREKLQVAKQRAAEEIGRRMEGTNLPQQAEQFLTQAWTDRLVFILLRQKEGELSEDWNRSLQTADELIWMFGPEAAETGEVELQHTGSAIKEEIDTALESLGGYHQSYLAKLFEFLEEPAALARWHKKLLEAPSSEPLVEASAPPESAATTPASMQLPADETPSELLDESLPDMDSQEPSEQPLSEPEQEMLEQLQRLQFGTWFAFRGEGEETLRLKLSWLSPLTATCMFVDKNGAQAQIKTVTDTARMMVSGEAKVIPKPKQQFVERAMLAIKGSLQRSMQAAD